MTINFSLKSQERPKSALLVNLKINGKKITLYPGQVVTRQFWNKNEQIVIPDHPGAKTINADLLKWKRALEDVIISYKSENRFLNKEIIKEEIDKVLNPQKNKEKKSVNEELKGMDFVEYYDFLLDRNKNKWSKEYKAIIKQNKKHFMIAHNLVNKKQLDYYDSLGSRTKSKFPLTACRRVEFDMIDKKTFDVFEAYLYEKKTPVIKDGVKTMDFHKLKYIGKHIHELKRVVRDGIKDRRINNFTLTDLGDIKEPDEEVDSIYCDFEDIKGFIDLDLKDEEEIAVRDTFIFNCSFGQRYSDLTRLDRRKFSRNEKGRIVFTTRQKKTKKKVQFVLDKTAQHILEKYNFNLPVLSDVKFNKIIKRLAKRVESMHREVEINETRGNKTEVLWFHKYEIISSHCMRRSFCTNFYKQKVNPEVIMAISGHTTPHQLRVYIKDTFDEETLTNEVDKVPNMFA